MSRLDLLVLFIFSCLNCLPSSLSQHADIGADKAVKPPANDTSDSNYDYPSSEYFEDDSILIPGDANTSGIVPGNLPNNIENNPSVDCVEDEVASAEGKIAVDNNDAIAISNGGGAKLDKKNITKVLKNKRPCKTRNGADSDKQAGNRNDSGQNNDTLQNDSKNNSPGGINTTGKIVLASIIILVLVTIVAVVVAWYRCKMTKKVAGDVESGNCTGDISATSQSPDESSAQLLSKEITENAKNDEAAKIAGPERQFSTESDEFFESSGPQSLFSTVSFKSAAGPQRQFSNESDEYYEPSGPQSLFSTVSFKSTAGPQRQFSNTSYMTACEASGPQSILSNYSFKSTFEMIPLDSGSLESSNDKDACENEETGEKENFTLRIDGDAVSEKWEKRVSAPPVEEATNSEKTGFLGVFKKVFHLK
ncbi:uncharacterized protein LOC135497285 [Lineus longissimus]|uniref:uncharacterized protein LOC135497285 n=1 Tax=Lineus longissimus TaxID=88925 RepID=UPI002B4D7579